MRGSTVVYVVEVDDVDDVRIAGECRTGRQKTVRVVIDEVPLPEMFGVARVVRSGPHEEMGVTVGGQITEKLLEYVEILLVFEKALERIVAGWKLRAAGVTLAREGVFSSSTIPLSASSSHFGKALAVDDEIDRLEGGVFCVSVEQIWDNDVPVAMKLLELLLA